MTTLEENVALYGDFLVLSLRVESVAVLRRTVGVLVAELDGNRWSLSRRRVLNDLFPPAYKSRREQAEYEKRHGNAAKADLLAAARRVLAALDGPWPPRYPAADADDLLRVLGVGRLLFTDRDTPPNTDTQRAVVAGYLSAVQHDILVTLRPELVEVGPQ
ncbi:hypothetical protein [Kutzneria sp. NPDC052558]|uniref:hypothetical protein n=1 Tax=Kutzneria sp. NPDC052558 TaxID=3364121 RepID=UPI0037C6E60C